MATYTTKITDKTIERQLEFYGKTLRSTEKHDGTRWEDGSDALSEQIARLHPCDGGLRDCVFALEYAEDDYDKAVLLKEIQGIEREYATKAGKGAGL